MGLADPARGILHFLSGGRLPRVGFRNFWAVDYSCARDSTILGRWTTPARRITQCLSDGTLPRCRAWDSAIPERWTLSARGILHFPSGGTLPRAGFRNS